MSTITSNFNLLDGTNGFVIRGLDEYDRLGSSISNLGDLNGDGFDDIIIEQYVIFGTNQGFSSEFDLASLDGSNGFVLSKGSLVSDAGDINGDGFADIIVGSPHTIVETVLKHHQYRYQYDTYHGDFYYSYLARITGESYVIFGTDQDFPSEFDLANLDGNNGFAIPGIEVEGKFGHSVSSAGDVNGDGFDDIIVGAPYGGEVLYRNFGLSVQGKSYVIFGNSEGFPAEFDLTSLDGSNGFAIQGDYYEELGETVSSAGDLNGDGFDDLLVETEGYYNSGGYVVFGSPQEFPAELDITSIDGTNGFKVRTGYRSVSTLDGVGDINGDGLDDLAVFELDKSWRESPFDIAASYIILGSNEAFTADFNLSNLDGTNGFYLGGIDGGNNLDQISLSGAGDINGDGIDDLMIGVSGSGERPDDDYYYYSYADRRGKTYVVFGNSEGFPVSFNISNLNGNNGLIFDGINPGDLSGFSVSSAGDINGDTVDDLLIGAPGADEVYLIFGKAESEDLLEIDLTSIPETNIYLGESEVQHIGENLNNFEEEDFALVTVEPGEF